ncbi:MAG: hypothetical protein CMJ18_20650 [Phycisphaeraceae bacterium]|nr:hypothetical protein [Phycisphaeraceae bacterium]
MKLIRRWKRSGRGSRFAHRSADAAPPAVLESLEGRLLLDGTVTWDLVDNSSAPELAGFVTQDLMFNTGAGIDWTLAQLRLELDSGSIFQDARPFAPSGGDRIPPSPAELVVDPTAEFDTYVASGGVGTPLIIQHDVTGGPEFDTDALGLTWFTANTTDIGLLQLARVSLSDDAQGSWALSSLTGNPGIQANLLGLVVDGRVVLTTPISLDPASDSGSSDEDLVTHDRTPTVHARVFAGVDIQISVDGVPQGPVVESDGSVPFTLNQLSEGTREISVLALVGARTLMPLAPLQITIDATAPASPTQLALATASDTGESDSDGLTSLTTVTIEGTAEAGSEVALFMDGNQVGTAPGGNWSIQVSGLTEGTHQFTATARDVAGNGSAPTAPISVMVDTTAPTATIDPFVPDPRADPVDDATIVFDEPVFGFEADDLSLTVGGGGNLLTPTQTVTTADGVTHTLEALTGLTGGPGSYALSLTASGAQISDAAGNLLDQDALGAFTVLSNADVPIVDLLPSGDTGRHDDDNVTMDPAPTVRVTTDDGATVHLFVDGVEVDSAVAPAGTVDFNPALAEGTRTITATAEIGAQTTDPSPPLAITVDLTAPPVPGAPDLDALSDGGSSDTDDLTSLSTLTFSGDVEDNALVRLFLDGAEAGQDTANSPWSIDVDGLAEGVLSFAATAEDVAGNVSDPSDALVVTIDQTAPDAPTDLNLDDADDSGASNQDDITNVTAVDIDGDAESGTMVRLFVDGTVVGQTTVNSPWSIPVAGLAEGARTFTATATDDAGNVSDASAPLVVTIDTTAPTGDIVDVVPDRRSDPVDEIAIEFSESVAQFEREDLALTRSGGGDLLTAQQNLATADGMSFTLGLLTDLTAPNGDYVLTLGAGSGISDVAGNLLGGGAETLFTIENSVSVLIGGDNPGTVTYFEQDGTQGSVSVRGAVAEVFFFGNGIVPEFDRRSVSIASTATDVSVDRIVITVDPEMRVNSRKLTFKARNSRNGVDDGMITVGSITSDGGLGTVDGRHVAFEGATLDIGGPLRSARSATFDDSMIVIRSGAEPTLTKVRFEEARNLTIDSDGPVDVQGDLWLNDNPETDGLVATYSKSITVKQRAAFALQLSGLDAPRDVALNKARLGAFEGGQWDVLAATGKISAESITGLTADFTEVKGISTKLDIADSDITADAVGTISSRRDILNTSFTLERVINPADRRAQALKSLKSNREIRGVNLQSNGRVGKFEGRLVFDTTIFIAIFDVAPGTIPVDGLAFVGGGTAADPPGLGQFKVRGDRKVAVWMQNVFVASAGIGKIDAGFSADAAAGPQGFSALVIDRISYRNADGRLRLNDPAPGDTPIDGNLIARIV